MTTTQELATSIIQIAQDISEGDHEYPEKIFRQRFESLISCQFKEWAQDFMPDMERVTITGRRLDMLCGRVVVEYKAPKILKTLKNYYSSLEQAQDYIESLAAEFNDPLNAYFGIVIDGFHVGFIHWEENEWIQSERFPVNENSASYILQRLRAHSKKPLDPNKIAQVFGPEGSACKKIIPVLYSKLNNPNQKTTLLFTEWQRLFGQAVGSEAHQYPGLLDWALKIGININSDDINSIAKLFFSAHTYYALVIKLITSAPRHLIL